VNFNDLLSSWWTVVRYTVSDFGTQMNLSAFNRGAREALAHHRGLRHVPLAPHSFPSDQIVTHAANSIPAWEFALTLEL